MNQPPQATANVIVPVMPAANPGVPVMPPANFADKGNSIAPLSFLFTPPDVQHVTGIVPQSFAVQVTNSRDL
jgi:hypothetical protein